MTMRQDRWFVRSRGIALGPLTTKEIKERLFLGEFELQDKGTCSHVWKPLAEYPEFHSFIEQIKTKSSDKILLPPSPNTLRQKKSVPLPVLPDEKKANFISPTANLDIEKKIGLETKVEPIKKEEPVIELKETLKVAPPKTEVETPKKEEKQEVKFPERPDIRASSNISATTISATTISATAVASEELAVKPQANVDDILELFFTAHKEEKRKAKVVETSANISMREKNPARESLPPIENKLNSLLEPTHFAPPADFMVKKEDPKKSPIKIEIKLSLSKPLLYFIMFVVMIGATGALVWFTQNKTRDLKSITSSDPPSPTLKPSEVSDPISPLKAPTRPKRE